MSAKQKGATNKAAPTKSIRFKTKNSLFSSTAQELSLDVKVVSLRHVDCSGSLRAFATVQIGPVITFGWKVIYQPPKPAWVAIPQTAGNGEWFPTIGFDDADVLAQVRKAVLDAWRPETRWKKSPTWWRDDD